MLSRKKYLVVGCGALLVLGLAGTVLFSQSRSPGDTTDKNAAEIAEARPTAVVLAPDTPTPIPTSTPRILPPTYTPELTKTPAATHLPVTELPLTYYYVPVRANLRSCPRTTDECAPVVELSTGDSVLVKGWMVGEIISGNEVWYQVSYRGQTLYVHSSVISDSLPSATGPGSTNGGGQTRVPTTAVLDPFGCNGINDLDCVDFNRLGLNANAHLALCGDEDNLDGDGDGHACEDW